MPNAYETAVLRAVHDAPFVDPARQDSKVQAALEALQGLGLVGPSSLKRGALESTEKGARLLGYA